jgi:hypothetical protein
MTDNKLNEILYNKHFLERNSYNNKISKKDRKFYRKRILNLTRELFLSSDASNPDINEAFMNYVYHCVEHFKNTDTNDILQCEYADLDGDVNGDVDGDGDGDGDAEMDADDENDNMNTYNSSIMRKIVKPNTLDNFIIRNVIKKKEPEHLPLQKEINLKDPQLKVKGIGKKKNLINTYEEQENTAEKQENISSDIEIKQETENTSNA